MAARPQPCLVYVVDDNPLLGQVTAQIIDTEGHTTRFFTDPLEAHEVIENQQPKPDVLVTDYDLGPIVGFDLIELARRVIPGVQCLLVSGTVKPEVLARHPTKPDKFLPKPFTADQLINCVNELAGRRAQA